MSQKEKTPQTGAHPTTDNVSTQHEETELHHQALKAFIAKDYRRSWTLCLKFTARPVDERPLWIEIYVLRLQAYLLPSNVNAFMDEALRLCDEIERSFEVQSPTQKDLVHLEELRLNCEGHRRCFQSRETMKETLLNGEVGAMDLEDTFCDGEFAEWAREEMEKMFEWDTSEEVEKVSGDEGDVKEEVVKGEPDGQSTVNDQNTKADSQDMSDDQDTSGLALRVRQLEDENKVLLRDNLELKSRIQTLESYTTAIYEREQLLLKRRSEGLAREARYLEEDEEWASKHKPPLNSSQTDATIVKIEEREQTGATTLRDLRERFTQH